MINDTIAFPLAKATNKSFTSLYHPKKITIQRIFHNHWEDFKNDPEVIQKGIRPIVLEEVEKMLACGTLNAGFEIYECPSCHKSHVICYTCKSRFCNSCGIKAAKIRADYISSHTLNVPHRHIVFTIDERLRFFFKKDRALLGELFSAVSDTLFYVFNKVNGKKKSFKPGFLLTLHTFGRDLKWNPHIHCLCTEGGMDDERNYKKIKYISYECLRKSFMKQILDRMKSFYKDDKKTLKKLKDLIPHIYREDKDGFYVHAPKMKTKNGKDSVVSYVIRYTGRPVMAASRIVHYDYETEQIEYYYEDHKTKKRVDVKENVIAFMKKLVQHISEKQFKMIRYYGIYATCEHKHKKKVKNLLIHTYQKVLDKKNRFEYRKDLIYTFGVDPLLCDCGNYMEYIDYWVPPRRRNQDDVFY